MKKSKRGKEGRGIRKKIVRRERALGLFMGIVRVMERVIGRWNMGDGRWEMGIVFGQLSI